MGQRWLRISIDQKEPVLNHWAGIPQRLLGIWTPFTFQKVRSSGDVTFWKVNEVQIPNNRLYISPLNLANVLASQTYGIVRATHIKTGPIYSYCRRDDTLNIISCPKYRRIDDTRLLRQYVPYIPFTLSDCVVGRRGQLQLKIRRLQVFWIVRNTRHDRAD